MEGLEKAPDAINMLFTGANTGKLIVKVCLELGKPSDFTWVRCVFSVRPIYAGILQT